MLLSDPTICPLSLPILFSRPPPLSPTHPRIGNAGGAGGGAQGAQASHLGSVANRVCPHLGHWTVSPPPFFLIG